jgi:outer membrane protein assembly factor BamB
MKNINNNIFVLLICIIFLLGCSRSSDWVQFRGEGGRGVSSSRISPPLGIRWKINLQHHDDIIQSLNPPVVIKDTVYFGSEDGNFYALDLESGYMRWVFKSGAEINSIPYADKDHVYFGSKDGRLYALSRNDGQEVWTFRAFGQINSLVERYGDYIVFVGDADAIYFLSPDGSEEFYIYNPGWYNYTFLLADNVLYFGTGPTVDLVGPYDIEKREFLWFLPFHSIDANWYSFPVVKGDLLYFGTADIYRSMFLGFFAFNRHTGEMVWDYQCPGVFPDYDFNMIWDLFLRDVELLDFMAPTIWKNLVIYTGGDMLARAFDAETGEIRWERTFDTPVSSAPTIAGDRVYFGILGNDNTPPQLICLSARDGRILWQMDTEGSLLSAPVIAGKRIIFGTDRNIFYVLEQVF